MAEVAELDVAFNDSIIRDEAGDLLRSLIGEIAMRFIRANIGNG